MAEDPPLLARLLGADRYLRLMVFTHDRPGTTIALGSLPFVLLGGWLVWLAGQHAPSPATHDGYLTAWVLFSEPIATDDADISTRFHVELPDGTRAAVTTRDLARAMQVIDTACVERLRAPVGRARDRLAWPNDCE